MAFTFETSGNNTFLVYAIQEGDLMDTMTLGMITNNRIPGIASVLYTQMNRDCFLKYNVTARVTVKQFFSGVVNRRRLLGVFSSVAEALAVAEEYMIDTNTLLLDTDYIYADVSSCRAEMICLPVAGEMTGAVDCGLFFKNIMFSTQFDQTENCDYVAGIINYLNSTPVFMAESFLRLLEEFREGGSPGAVCGTPMSRPLDAQSAPMSRVSAPEPFRQSAPASVAGPAVWTRQPSPVSQANVPAQSGQSAPLFKKQRSSASSEMGFATLSEGGKDGFAVPGQGDKDGLAVPGEDGNGGFAVPGQSGNGGFAVPGQGGNGGGAVSGQGGKGGQTAADQRQKKAKKAAPGQSAKPQSAPRQSSPEKEMSMLYLLQHYNKENVAAYKAQREAKKKGGKETSVPGSASVPDTGFSVPGQQTSVSSRQSGGYSPVQPGIQPSHIHSGGQSSMAQPGVLPRAESACGGDNFGDTVVMGADGYGEDTVVTGESMGALAQRPYLLRGSNNEKILLDKSVFHIGKERSYVDYCISGNATVSRSHADIIDRNGQFFIVDNNSTNHTYVNGVMIPSNTEIPLSHGTKIRLSNEEFEFLTF